MPGPRGRLCKVFRRERTPRSLYPAAPVMCSACSKEINLYVFDLADRVSVIKNGLLVGTQHTDQVTKDEVLGMIILGKNPGETVRTTI